MSRSRIQSTQDDGHNGQAPMDLALRITNPVIHRYLSMFEETERIEKAEEALLIGVLAKQQATLSLDTQVVQESFACFEKDLAEKLCLYLGDRGMLPNTLDGFLGEKGLVAQLFAKHFDPADGRLAKLIDNQVGPNSRFAKVLDPANKVGVIALIEKTVRELVESKLNEVLGEFSLDDKNSAMSRLKGLVGDSLVEIKEAIGVEKGKAQEAKRGHVKGMSFQQDLYQYVAHLGEHLDDETDFVANSSTRNGKEGDHLVTLGPTSGAPDLKIVIEVKDRDLSFKKAKDELARAKENRGAALGIFVWAKGSEPAEVDDLRLLDGDLYCTADKVDLANGTRLPYLETAYKVARVLAVMKTRKESAGQFDPAQLQEHIDAIAKEASNLVELAKKAARLKKNGQELEDALFTMHQQVDNRLTQILELLNLDGAA